MACTFVRITNYKMDTTSYLLLRLAVGASMIGHGLVRLPKLHAFSNWMVGGFEKSILPKVLVVPFSYALPIAEFLIGLLLIVGLFTRQSLTFGGIVMIILIFGTAMIENWDALPSQLIHIAFFALLLQFVPSNSMALDNLFKQ
jgi:thiosulfate dehydrogenase (quinone) large subunit